MPLHEDREPTGMPPIDRLVQQAIDALEEPFFIKDRQHRWVACNHAFARIIGQHRAKLIGHSDPDFLSPEQARVFWQFDDQVFTTGKPVFQEGVYITSTSGHTQITSTHKYPLRNEAGDIIGLCGLVSDITQIKQREEVVQQLEADLRDQAATIEAQTMLIAQVSVPVIQVWEQILLLPLIGVIDTERAGRITQTTLDAVARNHARVLLIDITGVPLVDTSVARYLLQSIQATRLLGCESVLVGVGPHTAQTIVALGLDFSHITTRATLQQGLDYGLRRLGYMVYRQNGDAAPG